MSTLELLVVEDYMIVYLHAATPTHKLPSLRWLKRCQQAIDHRCAHDVSMTCPVMDDVMF